MNYHFITQKERIMNVEQASKVYQNIESEMAELLKAATDSDAHKTLGVSKKEMASLVSRLADINAGLHELHHDINIAMGGPGDKG